MLPLLGELFGNPHSIDHSFGWGAAEAVALARAQVADLINADDDEIVFTSGATESCNLALRGIASGAKENAGKAERNRILTLGIEHPAVYETALDLRRRGYEVEVLPVGGDGIVDVNLLERALDGRVLLVSIMAANNEIGVLQPIPAIAERCHGTGALLHTDATQAAGRLPIDVDAWQVDLLSLSAHKIYGPKGVGALFVRSGINLQPMLTGGAQENGRRGGTLPAALIAGFGAACEVAAEEQEDDAERMRMLSERLLDRLRSIRPALRLFGHARERVAGNLNLGFPGVPGAEVARNVRDRIAISSGSACSSASTEPSRVLLALGLDADTADTGFRVSLGRFTTERDIDLAAEALCAVA